jgi:hypothetical protein
VAENNYLVIVMDRWGRLQSKINAGGKEVEMRQLFEKSQDAERWARRRLIQDCEPGSYALVQHTRMMTKTGEPLTLKITREESFAPHFPKAKAPAVKTTLNKSAPLTFRWIMRPTRVEFSRG